MKRTFEKKYEETQEKFVQECFDTIQACVQLVPHSHLHINSVDYIFMKENENGKYVPYLNKSGENIEIYSDYGWDLCGLAHWADVSIDIISEIMSGNGSKYGYKNVEVSLKNI